MERMIPGVGRIGSRPTGRLFDSRQVIDYNVAPLGSFFSNDVCGPAPALRFRLVVIVSGSHVPARTNIDAGLPTWNLITDSINVWTATLSILVSM